MSYEKYINKMVMRLELKGCTQTTLDTYYLSIKKLLNTLNKPLDNITTDDITNYLHQMIS